MNLEEFKKKNRQISMKAILNVTIMKFFKILLYNETNESKIKEAIDLLIIIYGIVITIIKDRHYARIRHQPKGKWSTSGGSSGRP